MKIPVRRLNYKETSEQLAPFLARVIIQYLGISKDKTDPSIILESVKFIKKHYGSIGISELEDAFSMAAADKFDDVSFKAYGGVFSINILGDILKSYMPYRNRIVQELEKEKAKIEEKKRANEIEQKNAEARELICSEIRQAIEASKEGIPNWDNWQGVPHHYAKIAVDYGIINPSLEEKKAIWEKSQLLAIEEMRMDALSDSKTIIQKREIMDALKKIEQGDNSNLEGSAKRIYSKLLLWEYVK